MKTKYDFIAELRKAVKAYKGGKDVPLEKGGFGWDKDGSPMTVAKFVQGLEGAYKHSSGLGRERSMFTETPGHGWNIILVEQAKNDKQSVEDFCKHTNFIAGYNHPDKKKVLTVSKTRCSLRQCLKGPGVVSQGAFLVSLKAIGVVTWVDVIGNAFSFVLKCASSPLQT